MGMTLDLAYEVQRRRQSGFAFFPLGRAHFAWVSGNVLSSLDLTQQLSSITAYTTVVQLDNLDLAFRVDHEGTAVGQAGFFDQHVEVARNDVSRVTDQRVFDLADGCLLYTSDAADE